MTRSRFSVVTLLLVGLALCGCGLTRSPADDLTFKAPDGWKSSPGIMGFMQFWTSPVNDEQVLMLFKSPRPLKVGEAFGSADLKDARVDTEKAIAICGNQPAQYFKAHGTLKGSSDSNVEMVMTNAAGSTYMAMYAYPAASQADAGAEGALRELCTK